MFSNVIGGASDIGLSAVRKIADLWAGAKADNLIDYTSASRVEPICLVDMDCAYVEQLPDIMQSLQSIFTGYYLQAFTISLNVGKIEVMRHLDKLNPSRNPANSAGDSAGWLMSQESYQHRLPSPGNALAMEAEVVKTEATVGKDVLMSVKDMANLSVGKQLSVEVSDGCHKGSVVISVRLLVSSIPSHDLIHILSAGNKDTTAKERYHAWRAGRLDFIKDLVLCQDLIDAHRKNLINDKTGLYAEILARRRKNQLSTLFSGNPSVATASNILVCSTETISALEGETGMDFHSFTDREKLLKETGMMLVAIVDKQWERVTIYSKGIKASTQVGMRDLKASNKNSGPDVADILSAYRAGSAPSL